MPAPRWEVDCANETVAEADMPALDMRRRPAPRRRPSLRWLAGTVLTGVTAGSLFAGALHAALKGRATLAEPARVASRSETSTALARKGDRPLVALAPAPQRERIVRVPTVTRLGPSFVIRNKPFAFASAPLGIAAPVSYAPFDPLAVYSTSKAGALSASSATFYEANVESPVTTRRSPFPLEGPFDDEAISQRAAALAVAAARPALDRDAARVAALPYLSPEEAPAETSAPEGSDPFAVFDRARPILAPTARPAGPAADPTVGPLTTALTLEAENVSHVERMGIDGTGRDTPMAREEVLTIAASDSLVGRLKSALTAYGADPSLAARPRQRCSRRPGRRQGGDGARGLPRPPDPRPPEPRPPGRSAGRRHRDRTLGAAHQRLSRSQPRRQPGPGRRGARSSPPRRRCRCARPSNGTAPSASDSRPPCRRSMTG